MASTEGTHNEDFYRKLSRTASVRQPGKQATPRRGAQAEFRDTIHRFHASQDVSGCQPVDEDPDSPLKSTQEKRKLVIILVGLPGRGKTYLCNKLMCYLNWLGHKTRHFNVGAYRRQIRITNEELSNQDAVQDASFFDHTNKDGMRARQMALEDALEDLKDWLRAEQDNQVAIFDATNSTEERRNFLRSVFQGQFQYMFIESICNHMPTLEKNYRLKMMYSPDYQGIDTEKALEDFRQRILEYEKVYQPLTDGTSNRELHFIQLNNMVTGHGHMDVNRISGYIPGKIVFFLMQVCSPGLTTERKIWLSRHGESEFNRLGKIGGDAGLTSLGQRYAERLPDALVEILPLNEDVDYVPVSVWTSTLQRTIQTNKLPFPHLRWKALDEIHAGVCDGMTYPEVQKEMPEVHAGRTADKLRYRYPAGESYLDVIQRLEPVIIECERERESIVIIGHQAILRVLYGYFMKIDIDKIPELSMPLHTLVELTPRPDGTMVEQRYEVNISEQLPEHPTRADLFLNIADPSGYDSPGSASPHHPTRTSPPPSPLSTASRVSQGTPSSMQAASPFSAGDLTDEVKLTKELGKMSIKKKLRIHESAKSDTGDDACSPSPPTFKLMAASSCASSATLVKQAMLEAQEGAGERRSDADLALDSVREALTPQPSCASNLSDAAAGAAAGPSA